MAWRGGAWSRLLPRFLTIERKVEVVSMDNEQLEQLFEKHGFPKVEKG